MVSGSGFFVSGSGGSEVTRTATSVKSVWFATRTHSSPPSCCLTLSLLLTILASTTTASDHSDQSSQPAQTQSGAGQEKELQGRDFCCWPSQGRPPQLGGEATSLAARLMPPPQEEEQEGSQLQSDHWQSVGQQPGEH